jgi:hypothetical protein
MPDESGGLACQAHHLADTLPTLTLGPMGLPLLDVTSSGFLTSPATFLAVLGVQELGEGAEVPAVVLRRDPPVDPNAQLIVSTTFDPSHGEFH